MLQLKVTLAPEGWDEQKEEFVDAIEQVLELEHSLVSVSKWESKYCKPFISTKAKTYEETLDYIKFMTLTPNVDPHVYECMTKAHIDEINSYIEAPMTATTVRDNKKGGGGQEAVTSELIYYWMIALQIPSEYQYWHLNRLLMLVKVCNAKNQPPKKMSNQDVISRNKALNEARKKQYNTKG
ncbi:MAG: hypothetical protein IKZ08_02725 [Bacteroidales bacterium]|nr:hypothetical protein [Bacteroidales bacterium]